MTPLLPPNFSNLASISPKVLDTLSLPGSTLKGPYIIYYGKLLGKNPWLLVGEIVDIV
jgi:hypothetical protein